MITVNRRMQGFYRLKVGKDGQEPRVDTGWFENLITDNGLDLMYTWPTGDFGLKYFGTRCCVGTGNTVPAVTDTSLASFLAQTGSASDSAFGGTTFVEEDGVTPAYWKAIASWRFSTGTAAGNLAEIGMGATSTNLFSRALIVDGAGNPTTITVLSDEVLDVTYELRVYIDKSQVPITISISGTNYSGYVQPFDIDNTINSFQWAWAPSGSQANLDLFAHSTHTEPANVYAGAGAGSSYGASVALITSYVIGTYYLDIRYTWAQASANVAGGIQLFYTGYGFTKFMIWFDDPIPKQNFQTLTLDIRFSWDRF